MSLSTQHNTIAGRSVIVVQYPGMEGLKIWTNLVKLLGPSVALLGKALGGKDAKDINVSKIMDMDLDLDNLFSSMSEALVMATDKMDENVVEQLVMRMLSGTKIDNKEIDVNSFNILFAGNYGLLFKVLAFTLKVNYSSFLGDRGLSTGTDQNPSLSSVQV